jgi:hypothetical protein
MYFVDILKAESVSGYFTEQAIKIVFKYLGESIQNTISAFIWPVHIIEYGSPRGFAILAVM